MKKLFYFLPAVSITIIFAFLNILMLKGSLNYSNPLGVIIYPITIALLFVSAILMSKNKWWGCLLGISVSICVICMGMQETGQIFKEWIIGISIILYYIMCGYICYADGK